MNHSMLELALGFVLGCVLSSGVWSILQALSKNERRYAKQRRTAMQEIAAECAEIDGKISALALKTASAADARTAVEPRIEKVNKMLTVNLPFFDVYFVKYIEALVERYEAAISPTKRLQSTAGESKPGEPSPTFGGVHPEASSIPVNFDQTWQFDFSKEPAPASPAARQAAELKEKVSVAPADFLVEPEANKRDTVVLAPLPEKPKTGEKPLEKTAVAQAPTEESQSGETVFPVEGEPVSANAAKPLKKREMHPAEPVSEPKKADRAAEKKKQDIEGEIAAAFGQKPDRESQSKAAVSEPALKKSKTPTHEDDSAEAEILLEPEKAASPQQPSAAAAASKEPGGEFISSDDLIDKIDTFFGIKD